MYKLLAAAGLMTTAALASWIIYKIHDDKKKEVVIGKESDVISYIENNNLLKRSKIDRSLNKELKALCQDLVYCNNERQLNYIMQSVLEIEDLIIAQEIVKGVKSYV